MRKTTLLAAGGAVIVIAGSYLAGYLPQRSQRVAAEARVVALQDQLAAAESRVRAGQLLGQALTLKELVVQQNYGQALERSSAFFDAVRVEVPSSQQGALRDAVQEILAQRDVVTAALAKGDRTVVESLHGIESRLRRALGFTMPPEPAP